MRLFLFFLCAGCLLSCGKDKYTTAPQIEFVSLKPNSASSDLSVQLRDLAPKLTFNITDAEGDFGFVAGKDTSLVFIKNLSSGFVDSFLLPDLNGSASAGFKAEVTLNLFDAMDCTRSRPYMDTTYYEVYVTDFAKNKSNVMTTPQPLYYFCQ